MPEYRDYQAGGEGLRIEVEGIDQVSTDYSEVLTSAVSGLAQQVAAGFESLPEAQRPQQLTFSFALRALSAGGFAIAQGADTANFRVTLTFGSQSGGGLLTGLVPRPR
jgi:hypothetical protein